jgi:5-(carboxyamino)imidazole ribonucleotide mutase
MAASRKKADKADARKTAASVCVVMGSDSDLEAMKPCLSTLESFGIPFIVAVASAHRTPKFLEKIIIGFEKGGGQVVIAAAGAAAHLPGVVASLTPLPVIGVPMKSALLGFDSLLSIVQMPSGVPVATVGVGVSANAALLAAQMLSLGSPEIKKKYIEFRAKQAEKVIAKSKKLEKTGYKDYTV